MEKNDELDHLSDAEMSRRLMADIDELIVEHQLYCDSTSRKLASAVDHLQMEAMGMTTRPFDEDARHKLSNAIYLPILGGEVLRNGQRLPSPTFKVSTLERAIRCGHLAGRKETNKWTVSIRELADWLSRGASSESIRKVSQPRTEAAISARDNERKIGASQTAMSKIDALMNRTKAKKK